MSGKTSMKGKRKLTDVSDGLNSPKKSSLLTQINTMSPASSPLKGPLIEDDTESGSPSFAAKCFYGFKNSSSVRTKENNLTPKKKNVRQTKQLSSEPIPRILQDTHLNEKLLDRIAASPIKQAVLQRCSIEEFRRLYRDEIKEIEQEENLAERRITRKLSKIVWKQNDSDDNSGSSDDGIDFKISNRGFDVDSISNGSSSIQSQDVITPVKTVITPVKTNNSNMSVDCGGKGKTSNSKDATNDKIEKPCRTPPSAVSTSERKFFKSKSVGKSVGTSSVLLSKGFNLRFVRQSKSCGKKKKGKNKSSLTPKSNSHKKTTFAEKLRLSYDDSLGSTVLTASSQGSIANETTPNQSMISKVKENEKYTGDDFDDDGDLVVMKGDNFKTFELVSPKRQRLEYSRKNESPYNLSDISSNDQDKSDNEDNMKQDEKDVASNCVEQDNDAESPSSKKLFPIFMTRKTSTSRLAADSLASVKSGRFGNKGKDDQSQLIIDAGQKKFGATQCRVCGMVYCHANPSDENSHLKFHKRLLEVLKFPGWKKERVVQENPLDCGRIILVLSDDPKSHRKKVEEIYEVMGRELGFPGDTAFTNPYQKVFLYISIDKEIEGCCVAEPIKEGNRVIPGDMDSNDASGRRPWCCEKVPEPALIGISRLWVAAQSRRSGVASRLMEAVQQWFDYGSLIPKDKIAFSDPTPDGRRFAHKFMGTPTFLVYKYKCN